MAIAELLEIARFKFESPMAQTNHSTRLARNSTLSPSVCLSVCLFVCLTDLSERVSEQVSLSFFSLMVIEIKWGGHNTKQAW